MVLYYQVDLYLIFLYYQVTCTCFFYIKWSRSFTFFNGFRIGVGIRLGVEIGVGIRLGVEIGVSSGVEIVGRVVL